MKYLVAFITFLSVFGSYAQIADNFDDGDFTTNPTWSGDDSVFTVVDVSGDWQLRSNKSLPSQSYYLSTASSTMNDTQWEFFTQLQFNTSSANYVDIFLSSDNANLLAAGLNGYFVRIGGTADEICLYKKVAGVNTKIIDGTDGVTNVSNNTLKIKVTRTAAGDWALSRDISGTGASYVAEGSINDLTFTTSSFFGFAITHSTASFILKHFLDDIYVGPIILDTDPPILVSATAVSSTQVDVLFNENLSQLAAEDLGNYAIAPVLSITNIVLDIVNPALVHITVAVPFTNGTTYNLTTNNIEDLSGNIAGVQDTLFMYLVADVPVKGDVIVNEFFPDPSPQVGLPNNEFIEIYNKSTKYFDLTGWKVGDGTNFGTIGTAWLLPGEYKVLTSTSYIDSFPNAVAVTSWAGLNNADDSLVFKSNLDVRLDAFYYTDDWYQDDIKKDGGYTIELINPNDPCSDASNWKASNSVTGGTPSLINSIYDATPDTQVPTVVQYNAIAPNFLEVFFSENMDSTSLANSVTSFNPNLTINNTYIFGAYPNSITFQFLENLTPSQYYTITLENVMDCWSNQTDISGTFILPDTPDSGDVIINEILFDPYTGGYDWIEVYNKSSKVFNLKNWSLANYGDTSIANIKTILGDFLLKPNSYAVIGKDSIQVKQAYPFAVSGTFCYLDGLPSYNNDSSTVYLMYGANVMDKVSYKSDWHFKLLDVTDGVSLERIEEVGPSDTKANWHSAAEAIGWASPGMKNSQYVSPIAAGRFNFTSETISPDNDGFEDFLQVVYQMESEGMLGTFTIYDDKGRKIRELFKNELLATGGTFTWDGVTDENVKASIGMYVAVFEAFDIDFGKVYAEKKAFLVAGKL